MKPYKYIHTTLLVLFLSCVTSGGFAERLVDYVNPLIGTGWHGHTYPGVVCPFGMVQLSPDNGRAGWDWCSGYHYSDTGIAGFSYTHLSGTGIGDMCDISILPIYNKVPDTVHYTTSFYHNNEHAQAGYYTVLMNNGVFVELTATPRNGYTRYTFPKHVHAQLQVDLGWHINWDNPVLCHIDKVNDTLYTGYRYSRGWDNDERLYFAIVLNKPAENLDSLRYLPNKKGLIAFFNFPEGTTNIETKLAISFHSVDAAINNLNEVHTRSFDDTKKYCQDLWEQELQKVRIKTFDSNVLVSFYTGLYHTCLAPNVYNDLGDTILYTNFSIWDIFRSWWPLAMITERSRISDFCNSMLRFYDRTGLLPVWDLQNTETNCMTGYHVASLLSESILNGITGFNVDKSYQAMVHSATQRTPVMDSYIENGYVPQDIAPNSVTLTLDYAYDDWCIAQVAKKLGKTEDYQKFMKRSESFKKLYDPKSGFLVGKNSEGQIAANYDPFYSDVTGHQYYAEGTGWQYNWFVPHAIDELVDMHGGKKKFVDQLDSIWLVSEELHGDHPAIDISGMIGQYDQGNEPSHQTLYTYSAIGMKNKTAYWAREICKKFYTTNPDGLPGNEDCGQMSAWYVLTALGFHPFCPADGKLYFGSPLITDAVIDLQNGKSFSIKVENNNERNKYIKSMELNGNLYTKDYIDYLTIENGGTLKIVMGDRGL
ncbi:MAG: GH92 family glycosyl hydrolase [Phycisphaerales bacterium]|nr:GH92 family glycosyl hydrolase [Phycisphaerales bacterium]